MIKAWAGACFLALLPMAAVLAQEEPSSDEVLEAVAGDAAEGEPYAEEPVADESAAVDTVPVSEGEEEAEAEPAAPWRLYLGLDQAETTLSVSGLPPGTPHEADSGFYRLRAGALLGQGVGVEFQYGIEQDANQPGEAATEDYLGLFLVPSTNLFDTLELAFPVGYARSSLGDTNLDSVAFGLSAELPLQYYFASLPNLRLVLGWMTYYQKSDARVYGYNAGLRFDFETGSLGNPFAGLDLWPFGDDAADAEGATEAEGEVEDEAE